VFCFEFYCCFDVGWRGRCCFLDDNVVVVDDMLLLLLIIDVDNGSCWRQAVAALSSPWEALSHLTVASGTFGEGPHLFSFFFCCCRHCLFFCILTPIFLLLVVSLFSSLLSFDFEGFAGSSHPSTKVIFFCIWRSSRDDLIGAVAVSIWRGGRVDSFARCLEDKLVR